MKSYFEVTITCDRHAIDKTPHDDKIKTIIRAIVADEMTAEDMCIATLEQLSRESHKTFKYKYDKEGGLFGKNIIIAEHYQHTPNYSEEFITRYTATIVETIPVSSTI